MPDGLVERHPLVECTGLDVADHVVDGVEPDRFAGRLRRSKHLPDVSDVMRRLVKENLKTFDGKRLFPPRSATTGGRAPPRRRG